MVDTNLLLSLLAVDSPSGDEFRMADWLTRWIAERSSETRLTRLRDCLVAVKGERPAVAVFAHIDTVGYTVAPDNSVYRIGHPAVPKDGAQVRLIGSASDKIGTLGKRKNGAWKVAGLDCAPGDRIVSATQPIIDAEKGTITSPTLDNRGGIYAALQTLIECPSVAVAFTTGEEIGAGGATICARHLWEQFQIHQALIADITWDTKYVHCREGVAISRRDSLVPSQRFVQTALDLAKSSGLQYQVEIESSGGSDGAGIEASGCPIDWVFVGAPEKHPHTPYEQLHLADLDTMGKMLVHLVQSLPTK